MKNPRYRFWKEFCIPFLLCFALVSVFFLITRLFASAPRKLPDMAIILSPHFDDAALSLGGFMAENATPVVVATFFAEKPTEAIERGWDRLSGFKNSDEALATRTKENELALGETGAFPLNLSYIDFQYRFTRDEKSMEMMIQSMEKNIKIMLEDFTANNEISIYGPSEFGSVITHPDHKILHDAFVSVATQKLDQKNLHFFFYEDFPYVRRYEASTTTTLRTFIEKKNLAFALLEHPIILSDTALDKKIESISAYTSQESAFEKLGGNIALIAKTYTQNRCQNFGPQWRACEVVYEIVKPNNATQPLTGKRESDLTRQNIRP